VNHTGDGKQEDVQQVGAKDTGNGSSQNVEIEVEELPDGWMVTTPDGVFAVMKDEDGSVCGCSCGGYPFTCPHFKMTGFVLDLYAGGPSGWSTALKSLGKSSLGLEMDEQACASRSSIGHSTLRCDVGTYPIRPFIGKITGLTASPPCQSFSISGKGEGRKYLDRITTQIRNMNWNTNGLDDRTAHVIHVGRWVTTLNPEWVCFEQVPFVQPMWDAYADLLRLLGYSVWTGKLCAADYGTPQVRTRSILAASRVREVLMPVKTHAKNNGDFAPWVTMSEALSWGFTQRPALTITSGGTATGGADPFLTGGSASRRVYRAAMLNPSHQWIAGKTRLDPPDALVLQDFNAGLPLAGSRTIQYKQIGNSIPVKMAKAILESVLQRG